MANSPPKKSAAKTPKKAAKAAGAPPAAAPAKRSPRAKHVPETPAPAPQDAQAPMSEPALREAMGTEADRARLHLPHLGTAAPPADPPLPPAEPVSAPAGEDWARQVAAARSAPIHVEEAATVQVVAPASPEAAASAPSPSPAEIPGNVEDASPAPARAASQVTAVPRGELSIPEQFLTIAIEGQWDDRMERVASGRRGAALVGSVLLELAVHGKVRVQRDHFVVEEGSTGDDDLDAFAQDVAALGPIPTAEVIRRLGRRLPDRIRPWKQRAVARGWLREDRRKFLGVFARSTTTVLDEDVQGKLQNRLVRMLAGGGNPDVKSIALLGLLQAAGMLPQLVPSAALAFNEKRISLLLSGKDPLHYRIDTSVRTVQDLALRTILNDVRRLR
ncbi:MAG TPA: GPP34 family phosphoprotein [Candidatus Thermoplasmatota archaeon]|nr:GPP34 family phosphoprotein [Candidatus Thermoplasmatota archaeon]